MKLVVLDFTSGNCHIFNVTSEVCEGEESIAEFLWEKGFNVDNVQYMYGNVEVIDNSNCVS